jgi:hypothetical protein
LHISNARRKIERCSARVTRFRRVLVFARQARMQRGQEFRHAWARDARKPEMVKRRIGLW